MLQLEKAYGAEKFLVLNIPPMQYSPAARVATENLLQAKINWIANYNQLLNESVHSTGSTASLFFFDTHQLFMTILSNPAAYGFQDTTDYWNKLTCTNLTYCPENAGGIQGATNFLWFDGTHVTSGKSTNVLKIMYLTMVCLHSVS
jgi:phospholipase/lecithinase/hemolysin